MSGCFPSEEDNKFIDDEVIKRFKEYMLQTELAGNRPIDLSHTDVNSPCYKNHQLIMERLEKLENFLFEHKLGEKNFYNRVQDLETSIIELNSQIDDLSDFESKNGERIDKIEEYLREVKLLYSNPLQQQVWQENITKRLEKLEKWKEVAIDKNIQDVERIKELEQSILETRIQFIEQIGNDKKPYCCPACNGNGGFFIKDIMYAKCRSCEGNGVLWG